MLLPAGSTAVRGRRILPRPARLATVKVNGDADSSAARTRSVGRDQGLGLGPGAGAHVAHLDFDRDGAFRLVGPEVAALDLDLAAGGGEAGEAVAPRGDGLDLLPGQTAGGVELLHRH